MKHYTLNEKYEIIKNTARSSLIGIHNFGLLHEIGDALGMGGNTGMNLRSLNQRITKIMRDLIEADFPVKEYRIKCCSWSDKETWHACFRIDEGCAIEDGGV